MFRSVDDAYLAAAIARAQRRVIYVAPGLGTETAQALAGAMQRAQQLSGVDIVLDADPDASRIGYGDPEALQVLHAVAVELQYPLRRQDGLRIGLLVVDDEVVLWAPTARSVEPEREANQPNAIVLGAALVPSIEAAVGAEGSSVLPAQAEIGSEPLSEEQLAKAVEDLKKNPPAPFDLSQRTRVFSTRFQFVEFEVRGAEWTGRRISLSSLLINADLPESLQAALETRVRPFQAYAGVALAVPLIVRGQRAFNENQERIRAPMTQAEIMNVWSEIRERYLTNIAGFGWMIRRERLAAFQGEVGAFEETLREWVAAFRKHVAADEEGFISSIVAAIENRLGRAVRAANVSRESLATSVRAGMESLRVIEPKVRIVLKNVAWESSRDAEFLQALEAALPQSELEGWFEEFTAVRQRMTGQVR